MLTKKQYDLLQLIDQDTTWEGSERPGTVITGYFYPQARHWSKEKNAAVLLMGAGDAATIRSLYNKGLAKQYGPLGRYAAIVTEQGMIALEEYREANIYVNGKIPCLSPLDQHQDGCACRECDPEDVLDYHGD